MPELPEVEEVRRTLEPFILGKILERVTVRRPDYITPANAPLARLAGHRFLKTHRHGKKLFVEMDDSQTLLFHLGMSGRIDCVPGDADLLGHTHFTLHLELSRDVRFRDPRRFGGVWYYKTMAEALKCEVTGKMGPDALQTTTQDFAAWKRLKGKIKARLLSQKDVAGLGNIYVDEVLWQAQLHPLQRVSRIKPDELDRLVVAIRDVLQRSIASGGTTLRDYRNVSDQPGEFARQLNAYGRTGKPCPRCGSEMQGITAAGRTTVFCPICQRRR